MKRTILMFIVITLALTAFAHAAPKVDIVKKDGQIDVMVGEKLFTSYIFGDNLTKSSLVPVRTPSGIEVTRRHPLTELKGGTDDHIHHVGIFFTVDGVNGNRFWNNKKKEWDKKSPQIKHIKFTEMTSGEKGILGVENHWVGKDGTVLLKEEKKMVFIPTGKDQYAIDFSMDLTAMVDKVTFEDTEEGVFAIRLPDCLREPDNGGGVQPGKPLPKENIEGTGRYFSSNGDETAGDEEGKGVWGKRARWVAIQGVRKDKVVGVAILNHPQSINYPTYWHARDYGLFSANPLGQGDFQRQHEYKKNDPIYLNLTLKKGKKAHFRFLMIVYEGIRTQDQIEKKFKEFVK
jgi:hypothetical protein